MREAGDVCFADVYKDGSGVVEFLRLEDMKYAIKKLDDSRFRSHEVGYIKYEKFHSIKNIFFRGKLHIFEFEKIQGKIVESLIVRGI